MDQRTNDRIRRRGGRRAFSLIEVLIAIAIVLAIGSIVAVNLLPKKEQADLDLTRAQIDSIEQALKMFKVDMRRYPSEEEGLAALWQKSVLASEEDEASWRGPYLATPLPNDTWGSAWAYYFPSDEIETMYEVISFGPDREEDSEDDVSSLDRMRGADGELGEGFDDFGDGLGG